jgi:hypothetical protein
MSERSVHEFFRIFYCYVWNLRFFTAFPRVCRLFSIVNLRSDLGVTSG